MVTLLFSKRLNFVVCCSGRIAGDVDRGGGTEFGHIDLSTRF